MGTGDEDEKTKCIYNVLRKWGIGAFLALTLGLTIFDVIDDMFLGNLYAGPPGWLTTLTAGLLMALFGSAVVDALKK